MVPPFGIYSEDGWGLSIPGREFMKDGLKGSKAALQIRSYFRQTPRLHGKKILLNKFSGVKAKAGDSRQ
jgi:hypothetical protein